MTVKDLIKYLSHLDQDTKVVTRGYEGGYCELESIHKSLLAVDFNKEYYYGKHEDLEQTRHFPEKQVKNIECFVILN